MIGNSVADVFNAIMQLTNLNEKPTNDVPSAAPKGIVSKLIDLVSSIFIPALVVLVAGGIFKGIVAILQVMELVQAGSPTL
ncbi:PTS beta-glucoside transporter subunit IIABC, partial [Bifidobacterium sp. M0353]|nr:PTS beta-glucoside transporter subunit IIABC [Bifidobacterium sp. M0353]